MEQLSYFGVGALATWAAIGGTIVGGPLGGGMAAGFILGSGNYTVAQGFNSWGSFQWEQFFMSGLTSAAIGGIGAGISQTLSPHISKILPNFGNPIVNEIVLNSTVGATTGFSLSTGVALMDGAGFEEALEFGKDGLWTGFTTGAISGFTSGYQASKVVKAETQQIKFPGNDPTRAPDGFEWKGKPGSIPDSKDGNWHNPQTGESLRPDLHHPNPVGSHWDYRDRSGKWWRVFPNGKAEPK